MGRQQCAEGSPRPRRPRLPQRALPGSLQAFLLLHSSAVLALCSERLTCSCSITHQSFSLPPTHIRLVDVYTFAEKHL